ncbi:MAG TPA: DUF6049 family protein [Propionibacteriaceae bacterium]|nr:DUF6049 family protein [Propionibacteriaceae bacterium]
MPPDPVQAAPRPRRGAVGALLRVFAALLVVLAALAVHPSAHAAEPTNVDVALTTAEVTGTGGDAVLHLAGTITNSGSTTLYTVQVLTWRDTAPITSRTQLATALSASPTAPTGARLTTPGAFQVITGSPKPWSPGASSPFSVTAKISDLDLSETGVYLVGVHVRASVDMSASYTTVGRARTFITVGKPASQAATSSVVMLDSAPSYLANGLLTDDHLAEELTGRLLTLVRHAKLPGVTYAIDPLLYREVTTMAAGYAVGSPASHTPGTGQAAAAAWLAEFGTLSGGYRLPYGNPDLALLAQVGDTATLDLTTAAAARVPDIATLPLLVTAHDYQADQRFLAAVARLKPAVVLAETRGAGRALRSVAGTVIGVDPGAFAGGPGPDSPTTSLQYLARLHADSFLAAMNPAEGNVRVVANELAATLDSTPNPFETRLGLGDIAIPTGTWTGTGTVHPPAAVRGPALDELVTSGAGQIRDFTNLAGDTASGDTLSAQYLPPALSTAWPSDDQARAYLTAVLAPYAIDSSAITVSVAEHVVMTSRNTQFPVTVRNNLAYAVKVRVVVDTSNENRLRVPPTDLVTVDAGESVTVNVSPKATANGSVDAVVRLASQAGHEVGTPQAFVIEATETGRVAWVVVIASGVVLAAMTVLRIRQVARSPRRKEAV